MNWTKFQEREKQKEEEEREKERGERERVNDRKIIFKVIMYSCLAVAYAQIDWHDFVVVETVDFQLNEVGNLPPPTTPQEVGARVLAQERYEQMVPSGVSLSLCCGCFMHGYFNT